MELCRSASGDLGFGSCACAYLRLFVDRNGLVVFSCCGNVLILGVLCVLICMGMGIKGYRLEFGSLRARYIERNGGEGVV